MRLPALITPSACHGKDSGEFVRYYADEVMVQREPNKEKMFRIVEQSLKTSHYIASAMFASGMFTNHMEEAKRVDELLPPLSVIAEHWADTAKAFMQKHFPKTKIAVLGGHMMFWEHADKFNKILEDFIGSL